MSIDLPSQFAAFQRDYPYREAFCDGRLWRYRVGGAPGGPPVLVLTGATTVPDPLFVMIADLGQWYRVIAPAYPAANRIDELIDGIAAVLDAETVSAAHVVGSSFGGYLAQSLVRALPARVNRLVLAQTGVRHFAGAPAITVLRSLLAAAPTRVVKGVMWRTWQALLRDLGVDGAFWTALLRDILDHQLTKSQLLAVMAAMADFTAHHRPKPGQTPAGQQVLVLAAELDRAFTRQAAEMRAVYPDATFHTLLGAGHGALFTHTGEYLAEIRAFLQDPTSAEVPRPRKGLSSPLPVAPSHSVAFHGVEDAVEGRSGRMRVMVAYASKYGATAGIARRVGEVLDERGYEVDVVECADIDEASGYDAYVVGSATYEFNWRKEARKFIKRNEAELAAHPLWLFSSGPLGTEQVDKDGKDVLEGARPKQFAEYADTLHPRGMQVFRGAYDADKIRGADRIIAWMPAIRDILPTGDFREWDAIEAWAASIAESLQSAAARP